MVYSATRTKAGSSQHDLLMDVTKSGAADAVCETVRSELVYGKDGARSQIPTLLFDYQYITANMKNTFILAAAGLAATVHGHGFITSPSPRTPGSAMEAACGQQVYNNQASDMYGNIQGMLQVAASQSDYDAAACDIWLCKGYKYADNTANVQTYTAGEVVPIVFDIRAPHTGVANVSIVNTATNTVIGSALKSWDVYASTASTIPDDEKNFSITIPSDLGSDCSTAGDCVIQMYWNAASIDQTYESCIDFTVSGSGSSSASSDSAASSSVAASSAVSSAASSFAVSVAAAAASSSAEATSSSVAAATLAPSTSSAVSSAAASSSVAAAVATSAGSSSVAAAETTAAASSVADAASTCACSSFGNNNVAASTVTVSSCPSSAVAAGADATGGVTYVTITETETLTMTAATATVTKTETKTAYATTTVAASGAGATSVAAVAADSSSSITAATLVAGSSVSTSSSSCTSTVTLTRSKTSSITAVTAVAPYPAGNGTAIGAATGSSVHLPPAPTTTQVAAAVSSAVAQLTSALPSGALSSAVPTSVSGADAQPPSGWTLQDILEWITYLIAGKFETALESEPTATATAAARVRMARAFRG
ncbi:hypothetical protein M8818_007674 [Zalaria obscura]|uniref:Uncharacterized protein n=1 Tax=Zalaria obscura TaxID=2024903 RepID=A0ACC3S2R0_9PEZI